MLRARLLDYYSEEPSVKSQIRETSLVDTLPSKHLSLSLFYGFSHSELIIIFEKPCTGYIVMESQVTPLGLGLCYEDENTNHEL
jgi:hypothetical protein